MQFAFGLFTGDDFKDQRTTNDAVARCTRLSSSNELAFALVQLAPQPTSDPFDGFASFQSAVIEAKPGDRPRDNLRLFLVDDAANAVDCLRRIAGGMTKDRRERVRKHFQQQANQINIRSTACELLRQIPGVSSQFQPELVLDVFGEMTAFMYRY